jgi:ribosome maturation factor RimP
VSIAGRFEEFVRPFVEGQNAYVIDVSVRGERGGSLAEVFIDTDEGVTTGLCQKISKELARALDASDLFQGRYDLVVSSPGIERPLKFPRQYPKHVGRNMSVKVRKGTSAETLRGTLLEASAESILLGVTEEDRRTIRFDEIAEARVDSAW